MHLCGFILHFQIMWINCILLLLLFACNEPSESEKWLTNMSLKTHILDRKASYMTLNDLDVEIFFFFFFQIKLVASLEEVVKDISIVFL